MKLFDQPLTVTLTTAQWLDVQVALSDAWSHNEHRFPCIARENIALKHVLAAQTRAAIDAAAREIDERRAAREARAA
jgi:hypothetical protein